MVIQHNGHSTEGRCIPWRCACMPAARTRFYFKAMVVPADAAELGRDSRLRHGGIGSRRNSCTVDRGRERRIVLGPLTHRRSPSLAKDRGRQQAGAGGSRQSIVETTFVCIAVHCLLYPLCPLRPLNGCGRRRVGGAMISPAATVQGQKSTTPVVRLAALPRFCAIINAHRKGGCRRRHGSRGSWSPLPRGRQDRNTANSGFGQRWPSLRTPWRRFARSGSASRAD